MLARLHKRIPQLLTLIAAFSVVTPVLGNDTLTLNFGLYSADDATSVVRKYMPVLKALEHSMTAKLDRTVDIRMHIARDQEQGASQLQKGYVDFASLNESRYLESKSLNPDLRILAAKNAMHSTQLTPWVARSGMHDSVFRALRESMLTLKNLKVLTTLKAFGFVQSHDSQYANLYRQTDFTSAKATAEYIENLVNNSNKASNNEPALFGARAAGIQNERRNRNRYINRKQYQ